jgi:MurNAc alpha-1-phosphate uridylyltransferase
LTVEGWQPAAHLVMVANPAHHTGGDFSLDGERVVVANGEQTFTYAGIGVFSPAFFAGVQPGTIMKLRPCSTPPSPPAR